MLALLVEVKDAVAKAKEKGQTALINRQLAAFAARYDQLSTQGFEANPPSPEPLVKKRGRKKQSKPKNLLDRLVYV